MWEEIVRENEISIDRLMHQSGVSFGTSGARGLAQNMTDEICYAYTVGFLQYLENIEEISKSDIIAIGGDLRSSTDRILKAVNKAIADNGYISEYCGKLPTPAMAYYGLIKSIPTITVTGSHLVEDRNGIKFTKKEGEILKQDEAEIKSQKVKIPNRVFSCVGMLVTDLDLPDFTTEAIDTYFKRYVDFFQNGCLKGLNIGFYQHSAVGRNLIVKILRELGADVTTLGFSNSFIPVDTEALRPEDLQLSKRWALEYGFDAIFSTDGDGDRPLIADEKGLWMRGDIAGILCAAYLKADAVVTPVSSNSAVEKCELFNKVIRSKIGSPFVIEAMQNAKEKGAKMVVGYEANGGFLLSSDIQCDNKILKALPTRDATIVLIAVLLLSLKKNKKISELIVDLPKRFTFSDRLTDVPYEKNRAIITKIYSGDASKDKQTIEAFFGPHFGNFSSLDTTDGLRIAFESGEIIHLRPSGNAPEFRCYTEADTEARAIEMNKTCMRVISSWL